VSPLDETEYLLASTANAARLLAAIQQLNGQDKLRVVELDDLLSQTLQSQADAVAHAHVGG
jgi:hypothetical protein